MILAEITAGAGKGDSMCKYILQVVSLIAAACVLASCRPADTPSSSEKTTAMTTGTFSIAASSCAKSTGETDGGTSVSADTDGSGRTEESVPSSTLPSSSSATVDTSSKTSETKSTTTANTRLTTAATKPTAAPTRGTTAPVQQPIRVKIPTASGKVVYEGNGAVIDASNAADGYVMVKCSGTSSRLKLRIMYNDKPIDYDLNNQGRFEVFPLQMGNGSYKVRVMENISGTKYRERFSAVVNVTLENAMSPFLYPSQYVWFTASSAAVKKAYELCAGKSTDLQKIQEIYAFIISNISYDKVKAQGVINGTVSKSYIPDIDETLQTKKGICFDYAVLMAAMLRALNIPTKMVIGVVSPGDLNHAWNLVYTKEKGWIKLGPYFDGKNWKLMDSTFAASMGGDMDDYIGNGDKYTELRFY